MTKKILYFSAVWCGPCKMMGGIIDELGETFNIQKIDVDQNSNEVKKYHIKSVPTFILLENGFETKRIVGAQSKSNLVLLYGE